MGIRLISFLTLVTLTVWETDLTVDLTQRLSMSLLMMLEDLNTIKSFLKEERSLIA